MTMISHVFHDRVSINVEKGEKQLPVYYSHYFRHFETANVCSGQPDYEVREFSNFQLPTEHYNISNMYLGFATGICLPAESYALEFDNERIIEYTDVPNRATNLWLQTSLLRKGISLVHSAGLTLNGHGFIFPAFGGAGKTMLIASLRQHSGFKFFGDDFVAVDMQGVMYAYPSDLSVYSQHLELFSELQGSIYHEYFIERERRPKLWNAWYRLPGNPLLRSIAMRLRRTIDPRCLGPVFPALPDWDLDYVKVPARKVLAEEQLGISTPLNHCILLSRYSGDKLRVVEIGPDRLVGKLNGILNVEFRYGQIYKHLLASFGVLDLQWSEDVQRQILKSCFENVSLREVLIPIAMSPSDYIDHMQRIVLELAA